MAEPIDEFIRGIQASRKYRSLELPEEMLRELMERELAAGRPAREAAHAARQKLHNIVAPYLGDPDYQKATHLLEGAFATGDPVLVKQTCTGLLSWHASTRERLPYLEEFYSRVFDVTGRPESILDLACGLNPLSFLWMGLSPAVQYHAYDIHGPRVAFLNRYFQLQGLAWQAEQSDILLRPPQDIATTAFFFKEAHRFEQRRHGCNRAFWQALHVHWLLVSLPSASLGGHHSLVDRQRRLVYQTLEGLPWRVTELAFKDEMVFCIEKTDEAKE